jgi:signal peptidase II
MPDPVIGEAGAPILRSSGLRAWPPSSVWVWLAVAMLVVLLDHATKLLVESSMHYLETREFTGFFNLVLVHNTGAAFSLFADAQGWQRGFFIGIGVIASLAIVVLLRKNARDWRFCLALSLILGGALGNVWDRVALGHVIDFIQLHAGSYYWPSFNVADSSICCGAGLLVWDGVMGGRRHASK